MGKLHACLVVAVGALAAACGDDGGSATKMDAAVPDAKVWMDAMIDAPPMFDLSCNGNTAPTTAPANIALSGFVQEADFNGGIALTEVEGANVNVCTTIACGGNPPSATTDAAGDWAIAAVPTSSAPLTTGYLEMTEANVRTTYVYPGAPFRADQAMIPILTFGDGIFLILDGLDCQANEVVMAVAVTDCANNPITDTANVAITVKQGGSPVAGAEVTDLSSFPNVPPQVAGLFLVCNVPASDATEIGATYNGMTFLAHNVKTVAGTTTTTQVRPGY